MKASNLIVGCFVGLKPRDRIDFLCRHYMDIDTFRDVYRENVISIIGYMRTFEKNKNKEEGMNLHNVGHISDTTAQAAFERIMIEDFFNGKSMVTNIVTDADDQEIVSWAVLEWNAMKREHELFSNQLKLLSRDDREIFSSYMSRKITTEDIAERFCIEYESASKKIYRIKRKLVRRLLPLLKSYDFSLKEVG